jgi:hypothetical protein
VGLDFAAINSILSTRNGVWATFLVLMVIAWRGYSGFPAFLAALVARRQAIWAQKDAEWKRIVGEVQRYSERLQVVEKHDEDCQRQLTDALRRLAELEGFMMGQGKARQDAAAIVAIERLTDRENDKEGGGK